MNMYETDFHQWAIDQADHLRSGTFEQLDLLHLLEEVEGMGSDKRSALTNRYAVLIAHLLKWQFQPEKNHGRSWANTIRTQRMEIVFLIEDNPSLKHYRPELFEKAYKRALTIAKNDTGNNVRFPDACPWGWEQVQDNDFYPE